MQIEMPHNTDLSDLDAFISTRRDAGDRTLHRAPPKQISLLSRLLSSLSSLSFSSQPEPKELVCRICDHHISESFFEEHSINCSQYQDILHDRHLVDQHLQTLCGIVENDDYELFKITCSCLIASGQPENVILALAKLNYKLIKLQLQWTMASEERRKNVDRLQFLLKYKQDIYQRLASESTSPVEPKKSGKLTVLLSMVLKRLKKAPSENPIVYSIPSINDFDIIKPLSRGAFGSVYLCRHKKTKDLFSIKAIKKADSSRKNTIAHALTERRALALINSLWIVPLYFAFQSENHLFLVMEYMCGGDLGALLRVHQRLTNLDVVRFYAAELIIAVDQLHRAHIIHHDVKPENILIAFNGHIKLIDLGLSRMVKDRSDPEVNTRRIGTPDYMAPELVNGDASSTAVDVWAIGCVIYELYHGQPPFHADSVEKVFTNIKEGYKSSNDTILDQLIQTMLNPNPERRPTLEEVKDDPFFEGIVWSNRPEGLINLKPPFIPKPQHEEDTCYFEISQRNNLSRMSIIEEMQQAHPMSMHGSGQYGSITPKYNNNSPARSSYSEVMSTGSLSGASSNASLANHSPHDFAYKNVDLLEALNRRAILGRRSSGNNSPLRQSAAAFE